MQTSVEKVSEIGRKLNVVLPAEKVETALQVKLKKLAKNVKVQGFRKGKVPLNIVKQQYGADAMAEVLHELMQATLPEAMTKEKITPAVQPDVIPEPIKAGEDFTYTAHFDVYPEFSKLNLKEIDIAQPNGEISDEHVDKVMQNMQKQKRTWESVDRACQTQDQVTLDFEGSVDGESFSGGSAKDHTMVLGEKQMLPDFEKGIEGMMPSEERTITVKFPGDYHEDLGGKEATFEIKVNAVSAPKLPELDAEFVQSFDVASGELADLKEEVNKNLQGNLETHLKQKLRENVFDALLQNNTTEVPLKMMKEEAQRIVQEQKQQLIQQGIDPKMLEKFPQPEFETLKPQAEKRVRLALIMMQVIKDNEIEPDEERVEKKIETMASSYEDSEEFINYYKNNPQAMTQVQSLVLEEQAVEFLLADANIILEDVDIPTLLNI